MAENVSIDYDYIYGQSQKAFNNISAKNKKSSVSLILAKLLKLHPALQNMVLRLAFESLKGDTRRLTYQHTKELRDLIYLRPERSIVDLPFNISAVKNQRYIRIYKSR